jgi:hypothetical protein
MQWKHFQGYPPMFIAANCKSNVDGWKPYVFTAKGAHHLSLGHRPRELNRIQTSAESATQLSSWALLWQ